MELKYIYIFKYYNSKQSFNRTAYGIEMQKDES